MKTLKTLLVELVLTYLYDRSRTPFIVINRANLNEQKGKLPFETDLEHTTLNMGVQAIVDFNIKDNCLIFKTRYNGRSIDCVIPTLCIISVYDRHNKQGMMFEAGETLDFIEGQPMSATGEQLTVVKDVKQEQRPTTLRDTSVPFLKVVSTEPDEK